MTSDAGTPTSSLVSGDVRRHNLALILDHIARSGPSARSEIAEATGLTRGSVTALTLLLTEAGVLRDGEPVAGGRGRPITRLELSADGIAIVAAQLDADEAVAVVTTLAGEEVYRAARHHGRPMGRPDAVLDVLADVLADALAAAASAGRRIADLSVVVFAPVGGDPARVLADTDLGWREVDVLGGLRARMPDLPGDPTLASDATVAATAEFALMDGVRNAVYLKSDSGIGGALLSDGLLIGGAHGIGGSLGHIPIVPDGQPCECGQHGCLVTVAGPDAILAAAGLGERMATEGLKAATAELVRRIASGDPTAIAAWSFAEAWIARALQVFSMTLDPEVIVLGGYWAQLAPSIERAFRGNRPLVGGDGWNPDVRAGALGVEAALRGAIEASRRRILSDPLRLAV
ncbi:MAG: ROK family protein [Leifsonia sp.]